MDTLLFLAHTDETGFLPKAALESLTAAKTLSEGLKAQLIAAVFGNNADEACASLSACGATRFLAVTGPDFESSRYASDVAAMEAIAKAANATIILGPATSRLSRSLPGLAQRLSGRVDTHLTNIEVEDGKPVATRWYYRQRMFGRLTRTERPWCLTLDPGCFEPFAATGAPAPAITVETIAVTLPETAQRTYVAAILSPSSDAQTIRPDAAVLLVAGAGWTKKQADGQPHLDTAEELILGFLNTTKASLGSSKSLVDQGGEGHGVLSFLSHLHQVGQTGSTPRHAKGLATCCHGEEPHVVGWRFINERRAINLDASCGWAQGKADVLYVADAFALMTLVNKLLS